MCELNKQAESATTVRRASRTSLPLKTLPAAAAYVATTIAQDPHQGPSTRPGEVLAELMGLPRVYPGKDIAALAAKATEARAQVLSPSHWCSPRKSPAWSKTHGDPSRATPTGTSVS